MLISLLLGFIIGLVLALPPGPVAVTAVRLGLDKGLRHAALAALGAGFMDVLYCLAAISATSAAITLISGISSGYPMITLAVQLAVIALIFVYGIINIKYKKEAGAEPLKKKPGFLDTLAQKGPFLLGIAVSAANMVNPTFMPTLAYITMNVQKMELIENNMLSNILFSTGFGLGNFFWMYFLSRIMMHYKSRMSPEFLGRVYKFAGFTLIGFGTLLGYRVLTLTKWSEIIRLALAF